MYGAIAKSRGGAMLGSSELRLRWSDVGSRSTFRGRLLAPDFEIFELYGGPTSRWREFVRVGGLDEGILSALSSLGVSLQSHKSN
jgi:hypothetical protein